MKKNNFELIHQLLKENEELRSKYVMSLFSDLLNNSFLPLLKAEEKDLGLVFPNSLIKEAIEKVVNVELENENLVVIQKHSRKVISFQEKNKENQY